MGSRFLYGEFKSWTFNANNSAVLNLIDSKEIGNNKWNQDQISQNAFCFHNYPPFEHIFINKYFPFTGNNRSPNHHKLTT